MNETMTFAIPVAIVIAAIEAVKYTVSKRNGKSPTFQYTDLDRRILERIDQNVLDNREELIRATTKQTVVLQEIRDIMREQRHQ